MITRRQLVRNWIVFICGLSFAIAVILPVVRNAPPRSSAPPEPATLKGGEQQAALVKEAAKMEAEEPPATEEPAFTPKVELEQVEENTYRMWDPERRVLCYVFTGSGISCVR